MLLLPTRDAGQLERRAYVARPDTMAFGLAITCPTLHTTAHGGLGNNISCTRPISWV